MQSVSSTFLNLLSNPHRAEVKAVIGGTTFGEDAIASCKVTSALYATDGFDVGGCVAKQFEMKLYPGDATIPRMAEVDLAVRFTGGVTFDTVTNRAPYILRASGAPSGAQKYADDKIVGGTIKWNQLANNGNFAGTTSWIALRCSISAANNILTASEATSIPIYVYQTYSFVYGHVYLSSVEFKPSVDGAGFRIQTHTSNAGQVIAGEKLGSASSWTELSGVSKISQTTNISRITFRSANNYATETVTEFRNAQMFDLTLMFGPVVADQILAMETAAAGAGVAYFKSLFRSSYYAYNSGEMMSVKTSAHKITGASTIIYPLDAVELRGVPKLDASNNLYFDGDTYEHDGTVTRRYATCDLGALTFTKSASDPARFYAAFGISPKPSIQTGYFIPGYKSIYASGTTAGLNNLEFRISNTVAVPVLYMRNDAFAEMTAAEIKQALTGTILVYNVQTPTTETAAPFTNPQVVYPNGTEEYVDERDVAVPVGHETNYYTAASGQTTTPYLDKGAFFIDTRKADKTNGTLTLTGFDAMLKAEQIYEPEATGYPKSMADVVADIASIIGVSVDPRNNYENYTCEYSNEYTMRETLSFIAAAHCGNFVITDDNKLRLVRAGDTYDAIDAGKSMQRFDTGEAQNAISKVILNIDANSYFEAGDDNGDTFEATCPWGTPAMCDAMLAELSSVSYIPFNSSTSFVNPAAEMGDSVYDFDGTPHTLAKRLQNFDANFASDISAPSNKEVDHEYPYESPISRAISRKVSLGTSYEGASITRDKGLVINHFNEQGVATKRSEMSSDTLAFYNENGDAALYFDSATGKFKVLGSIVAGTVEAANEMTVLDNGGRIVFKANAANKTVQIGGWTAEASRLHSSGIAYNYDVGMSTSQTADGDAFYVTQGAYSGGNYQFRVQNNGTMTAEKAVIHGEVNADSLNANNGVNVSGGDANIEGDVIANKAKIQHIVSNDTYAPTASGGTVYVTTLTAAYVSSANRRATLTVSAYFDTAAKVTNWGKSTGATMEFYIVSSNGPGLYYYNRVQIVIPKNIATAWANPTTRTFTKTFYLDFYAPTFEGLNKEESAPGTTSIEFSGTDAIGATYSTSDTIEAVLSDCAFVPNSASSYDLGTGVRRWNNVYCVSVNQSSARIYKKDIADLDERHEILFDNLKPRRFKLVDGESGREHYGLIVDEVRDAIDAAGLDTDECAAYVLANKNEQDGDGSLRYTEFIALLIDELQKQKKKIAALEAIVFGESI